MISKEYSSVWVFKGTRTYPGFPSAVFSKLELAVAWIRQNHLTGTLTQYPVDISVYDWVVQSGKLEADLDPAPRSPNAIANFSSAYQEHYHYEDGKDSGQNSSA